MNHQLAVTPQPSPQENERPDDRSAALRVVVGDGTDYRTDRQQQRLAFRARCENIAVALANSSAEERAAAYASRVYSSHELSTAAALRPDLMPMANGEWEWIALTLADLD